jgi:ribosomal protein L37E
MLNIKKVKMVSLVALIVAFFLPWIHYDFDEYFNEVYVSGLNMAEIMTSDLIAYFDPEIAKMYYFLYLIPILSVIGIIFIKSRIAGIIASIVPLYVALISLISSVDSKYWDFSLGIGIYITSIAGIVLFISSCFKVEENLSDASAMDQTKSFANHLPPTHAYQRTSQPVYQNTNSAQNFQEGHASHQQIGKTCSTCGTLNKDTARFCSACGNKLYIVQKNTCSACGSENPLGARFCNSCGSSLIQKNS